MDPTSRETTKDGDICPEKYEITKEIKKQSSSRQTLENTECRHRNRNIGVPDQTSTY